MNLARGLLGGVKGAADAYSTVLKDESKQKYEDQKATTLHNRQVSLEGIRNTHAKSLAGEKAGYAEDLAGTKSGLRTGETQAKLDMANKDALDKRKEQARLIAETTNSTWGDMSEEEQDLETERVDREQVVSKLLASQGADPAVISATIKDTKDSWLNMDKKAKKKFIKNNGGTELAAYDRYLKSRVASMGKPGFRPTSSDQETEARQVRLETKMQESVRGAGSRVEALKLLDTTKSPSAKQRLQMFIDEAYPSEGVLDTPKREINTLTAKEKGRGGPNVEYSSSPDFNFSEAIKKFTTVPTN